jgi:hypothetical protein
VDVNLSFVIYEIYILRFTTVSLKALSIQISTLLLIRKELNFTVCRECHKGFRSKESSIQKGAENVHNEIRYRLYIPEIQKTKSLYVHILNMYQTKVYIS